MQSSSAFWQKSIRWIPGVLISLVAIIILIKVASWQDLKAALASIKVINIVGAITLTIISLIFRSMAWKIMLGGKTTTGKAFLTINEGYLLNNLLPFKLGEIGRAVLMGQSTGLGTLHVLSTIVIERAFDVGIAAGIIIATLPFAIGAEWAKSVAFIALALVIVGFFILFLIASNHQKVESWLEKVGKKQLWVSRWVMPKIGSLLEGLSILTSPQKFLYCFGLIVLSWGLWTLLYFVMLLPLVPGVALWQAAFVEGVLALGVAVPSAPAALGVYEGAMVGGLAILGISESVGLGYAIVMHFMQFSTTGVLGFWGLIREKQSLSKLFSQLQHPQNTPVE